MSRNKKPICSVDADEAYYAGNEMDGVYFDVAECPGGRFPRGWYVSAFVDCDTNHSVDDLVVDDGPYASEREALQGGVNAAVEWLAENGVEGYEVDPRAERKLAAEDNVLGLA